MFGWWHCWLWVQISPLAVIFHGIGLDFIGLKAWIININIHWKQLGLIHPTEVPVKVPDPQGTSLTVRAPKCMTPKAKGGAYRNVSELKRHAEDREGTLIYGGQRHILRSEWRPEVQENSTVEFSRIRRATFKLGTSTWGSYPSQAVVPWGYIRRHRKSCVI